MNTSITGCHLYIAILTLLISSIAHAEPALELYIRDADEVFQGDPISTTIDAQGRIELGLEAKTIFKGLDRPAVALAQTPSGLLLGTAGRGLHFIASKGKPSQRLYQGEGLVISAIGVHDHKAWFSTGPKGQILYWDGKRVTPWLTPKPEYIWSLLPENKTSVWAATGRPGQLLSIQKGRSKLVFESKETHLRAMIRHPSRGIIVGGGSMGIVYQILKEGHAHALYDSELEEVTAFAVDPQTQDLFVAIVSAKESAHLDPGTWIGPVDGEKTSEEDPIKGSEVVRIRPSGHTERIWTSKNEGALDLGFDSKAHRLLIATTGLGKDGQARIYTVETNARDRVTLLARLPHAMATGIEISKKSEIFAATAPGAAIVKLGPNRRRQGSYESVEQDLGRVSEVGRLWFDADLPKGSELEVQIRTGNTQKPDATWSSWSKGVVEQKGSNVKVSSGRYAQFRAILSRSKNGASPLLRSMHGSIKRRNLPPRIKDIFPLRRGVYLKPLPTKREREETTTLSSSVLNELQSRRSRPVRLQARVGDAPGQLTIAWRASDPNRDPLLFDVDLVYKAGRTPLKRKLEVPFLTFDSRAFPDGPYRVSVRASDRRRNSPEDALDDMKQSEVFIIDNTPPQVSQASIRKTKGRWVVSARALDVHSRLSWAAIAVDGAPWVLFPAVDGIIDGPEETFRLVLQHKKVPMSVQIRFEDQAGNRISSNVSTKPL